jgi:hypothetical protein
VGGVRRAWVANGLLALGSLAVGLAACELAFVPLLPYVPLKLHGGLHEGLRVFAQSSKAGVEPRDYVALLGDSYAQGAGDWLLAADPNRNGSFHSAHLLHEWTGRDVVSFGGGGASSLRGIALLPLVRVEWANATGRLHLDPPRDALVYFYEGNDLEDNLKDLEKHLAPVADVARLREPAVFQAAIDEGLIARNPLHLEAQSRAPARGLLLLRGLPRLLAFAFGGADARAGENGGPLTPGEITRARVAGADVALPDGLQGPALDLDEARTATALQVLEQSLARLRRAWPETRVVVVYIPAPLACYALTSARVVAESGARGPDARRVWAAGEVAARSDALAARVAALSRAGDSGFVDARPFVRAASAERIVHGPRDWKHLNRDGQEALAKAALAALELAPR